MSFKRVNDIKRQQYQTYESYLSYICFLTIMRMNARKTYDSNSSRENRFIGRLNLDITASYETKQFAFDYEVVFFIIET